MFWVQAIAAAVLGCAAWLVIPPDSIDRNTNLTFDWLGASIGVAGMVMINFAFNQGP